MHQVKVNRKAARRIASGHPWIFESDVVDTGGARAGAAVAVVDLKGRLLARPTSVRLPRSHCGCFRGASRISDANSSNSASRMPRPIRRRVVCESNAYRLVHGEGDLLPGLVVDRYADYLVMQTLDQGMDAIVNRLLPAWPICFRRWESWRATMRQCARESRCPWNLRWFMAKSRRSSNSR